MEGKSLEQLELNVFKRTIVRLDHLIEHYGVQLKLNWSCLVCHSGPCCPKAG